MPALLALALAVGLSTADLDQLARYDAAWSEPSAAAVAEAQTAFAGHAVHVAQHFLLHNVPRPGIGAYAFVLRALADPDAALVLIHALPSPPKVESGALDRHFGEVAVVVEAMLETPAIASDPRIIPALVAAAGEAGSGPYASTVAAQAVTLLGRCRGPAAAQALATFARTADPAIRTAAITALGWLAQAHEGAGEPGVVAVGERDRTVTALDHDAIVAPLARALDDRSPDVRREAADSLARLGFPESIGPLTSALTREEDAPVVDTLVTALARLSTPIEDPALARATAARCWEADVARPLFHRWLTAAPRSALIDAALEAPPTLRALALQSLVQRDALAARRIVQLAPPHAASAPPDLDAATVGRLLAADVELLGEDVSYSTREVAVGALWTLAGGTSASVLPWADRVRTHDARFWVSAALRRIDEAGYDRYRRRREAAAAGVLALLCLGGLAVPWLRPGVAPMVLAIVAWGATAFLSEGVLALPPWPLPLSNVRLLVALAAGASVWAVSRLSSMVQRILVVPFAAGAIFLAGYWFTRTIGFYPPDTQSGWVFIIEPTVGVVAAALAALVLALVTLGAARAGTGRFT